MAHKRPPLIRMDTSGTHLSNVFYLANYWLYDIRTAEDEREWRISHPRLPPGVKRYGECLWVEGTHRELSDDPKFRCSEQPPHLIQSAYGEVSGDFFGGAATCEFVREHSWEWLVVTPAFAQRLQKTKLRGISFLPYKMEVNQSRASDPKVLLMQSSGRNCERPAAIEGGKNVCPFCGKAFVVCPKCGSRPLNCLNRNSTEPER